MNDARMEQVLKGMDDFCRVNNISKSEMARNLGIPYNTFRIWFHKGKSRAFLPSSANLDKMEKFLQSQKQAETHWKNLWVQILNWWETQHRYPTLHHFADELGWDVGILNHHIQSKEMPPRLVVEKIANVLGFETSNMDSIVQEALRKAEKLKHLLLFLEEELAWFRDGQKEARGILREQLDQSDIGYIASLLTMLGDEDKFKRWLTLTSNRFGFFRKRRLT